ncbi:Smr/MutS family protein [Sphingomonas prati]|uniref:DNA-nicking Smr family endonuclease n=1 Tax=Sphingomonas prati TaxID=1843237 RepID=A0A7W9BU45_9SPHN|nr:Smr/MutS family protein [Sphingomonas prati]MBB5730061.1 DNA-nicking Smr family endonuclease [Sphingomonas prati]GGE91148.1 smr protein/Muts2-like [Sphingomonas prati]
MRRRLGPDEQALWRRVTADVRPLDPSVPLLPEADVLEAVAAPPPASPGKVTKRLAPQVRVAAPVRPPVARPAGPGETLDGGWDRRLRRGMASPDVTIDLHGYTLVQAHGVLEMGLQRALADGARLMLLVTGKPPKVRGSALDRPGRGAIRAVIGDWLMGSSHASRIASVRNAHPRHGGAGALYVILRRVRE